MTFDTKPQKSDNKSNESLLESVGENSKFSIFNKIPDFHTCVAALTILFPFQTSFSIILYTNSSRGPSDSVYYPPFCVF